MNARAQESNCLLPGHLLIFCLSDCFPLKGKFLKNSLVIYAEILTTEPNF